VAQQPVSVIILARGGGSLEDLWAFNNEALARAIAACPKPVVTGVGHEVDFTIADFVADVRAPTPSAAAELVCPDRSELTRQLAEFRAGLTELARRRLAEASSNLQRQQWALARLSPQVIIDNQRQRVDTLVNQAQRSLDHQLSLQAQRVDTLASRLQTLNPQATLARGYAIVQKGQSVVSQTSQVQTDDQITIKISDGDFEAIVTSTPAQQGEPS
jgi:exodeoxyribonuclease VII large subunit